MNEQNEKRPIDTENKLELAVEWALGQVKVMDLEEQEL